MSQFGIHKPASGSTTYVQDKGLAVWFNGMQDKGSAAETTVLDSATRFLDGMVIVDLKNQTARNVSTTAVSDLARVRGQMVHVPLAGSDGIIVLIGGGEKSSADLTHDWKGEFRSIRLAIPRLTKAIRNSSVSSNSGYPRRRLLEQC
jgi:hypothetical protein